MPGCNTQADVRILLRAGTDWLSCCGALLPTTAAVRACPSLASMVLRKDLCVNHTILQHKRRADSRSSYSLPFEQRLQNKHDARKSLVAAPGSTPWHRSSARRRQRGYTRQCILDQMGCEALDQRSGLRTNPRPDMHTHQRQQ